MLRTLKKNKILNALIRNSFRFVYKVTNIFESKILTRWDISGTVSVNVKGNELVLFSNCDDHCTRDLFYGIDWEESELEVWTVLAEKSNIIFDIGANTGIYSLLSAKVNPSAKIYAFEPNPVNSRRLKKNIGLNDCKNIFHFEAAVGDAESDIKFSVPANDEISLVSSAVGSFSESFFNIKYKEIEVPQMTLDAFVEQENILNIDLIKIDVEYYELNVLKGAFKTLTEQSPAILCEVFMYEVLAGDKPDSNLVGSISKTQAKDIQEFMSELGYYFYAVGNRGLLRVDNLLSNADGGRNYVFTKYISEKIYVPYYSKSEIISLLNS